MTDSYYKSANFKVGIHSQIILEQIGLQEYKPENKR